MKSKWPIALAGVMALSSLAGCASSSAGPQNTPHTQNAAVPNATSDMRNSMAHDPNAYTRGTYAHTQGTNAFSPGTHAYHYRNGFTATGFNQNLAERLTRVADDVPGVDRATVVVHGNDAVIGIRIRDNLAPAQKSVVEQQVHSAARAVSPAMNIRVTGDPAMFARIRQVNSSIYNEATYRTRDGHHSGTTIAQDTANAVADFGILLKDMGRTVTAPFR